ncbi:MAG: hypothetical protein K6G52_06720 [Treponemataceae bacterium]|nr:hypothetical protein [Treponemataceae bacterium]
MALKNLSDWNGTKEATVNSSACGTSCGSGKPEQKPAACGTSCGAGK